MPGKAVFDNVGTLATGTFFYLCLGKHGLEGVLFVWSLQNYPFSLACLLYGPASHQHLSTTTKFSIDKTKLGFQGEWFEKLSGTDGIWEFRVLQAKNIYRLFAFWDGEGAEATLIICTHGLIKKTQKTPPREIEKAVRLKQLYFESKIKRSKN